MFDSLMKLFCGEMVLSTLHGREEDEKSISCNSTSAAIPHVITQEVAVSSDIDDPELRILTEKYGALNNGRVIEISLKELLTLVPRKRHRTDAYKGLVSKLLQLGVKLVITTSRNTSAEL